MATPWEGTVVDIYYDTHPHWVVDRGCYALTLRCKGSLPTKVQAQLREMSETLRAISPSSSEAEQIRRRHFAIMESGLDVGSGYCPFLEEAVATALMDFLEIYAHEGVALNHWVIMPNHLHLLTNPIAFNNADAFKTTWRRFKGRSARLLNALLNRQGPFWQSSWYDRWIRSEAEYQNWIHYLRMNPVKAGLCDIPEDYPFLK